MCYSNSSSSRAEEEYVGKVNLNIILSVYNYERVNFCKFLPENTVCPSVLVGLLLSHCILVNRSIIFLASSNCVFCLTLSFSSFSSDI